MCLQLFEGLKLFFSNQFFSDGFADERAAATPGNDGVNFISQIFWYDDMHSAIHVYLLLVSERHPEFRTRFQL